MKTTVFEKGKQKMNAIKGVSAVALGSAVALAGALPVFAEDATAETAIVSGMTSAASSMTGLVTKADRCPDHDCCHCREVRYGTVQKTVWKSQFLSNTKHWTDGGEKSSPSFSMKGGYCETNKNTRACSSSLLLSGDYWNNWKLSDCTGG